MIFNGVINALGNKPWDQDFDLTRKGLPRSFIAIALYIPLSFVVARAAVEYNDVPGNVPYMAIAIILVLISLTFPLVAYILCSVFDKQESYRSWVIVRNWSILFAWVLVATPFALYLVGLSPFSVAFFIGMTAYLCTLAIDVRLASRIAGFDWAGSVFAGIIVTATSMMVLLFGMQQILA
jgi:hypothetical protein